VLEALCRPSFGAQTGWSFAQAGLVLSMWCAMALAMMLPTAGPMILTYADLAETAAQKGEPAVSPLVLAAGYVLVWLGAAFALMALQMLLVRLAVLDPAMATASPLFSGAVFIGAGLYQFSALKHACVTQCQHPFRFFFANWTADPRGVFRLGFRQGLYCLGCCWAMMLSMFAVGVMNVIWMAALGAIMAIEKVNSTTRFSRALGALFVLVGIAFIVTSVIAHWPMKNT
jgi:predicted metal-binding membrane protein